MAITPQKVNFSEINEVQNGQGITPEHINYPLRASALAQSIATNPINTDEIANTEKTPSLEIINPTTNPQLKAINLKGATGAKLVSQTFKGTDSSTGGFIYEQLFDDGTTATFITPPPTKLLITNSADNTTKYYSIRTTTTDDGGMDGYITFILR